MNTRDQVIAQHLSALLGSHHTAIARSDGPSASQALHSLLERMHVDHWPRARGLVLEHLHETLHATRAKRVAHQREAEDAIGRQAAIIDSLAGLIQSVR
jgi:hypothetical protein